MGKDEEEQGQERAWRREWPILPPGTTAPWNEAVGIMQNKLKSQTKNILEGMKSADKMQLLCSKEHTEAQGFLPRSLWALLAFLVLTPLDWSFHVKEGPGGLERA